jgi:hypothetical protein
MKRMARFWIRLNVLLQVVLAIVAVVAVNYAASGLVWRADFSRHQKFALAEQTKRVIRELEGPVDITVFFSQTTASPVAAIHPDVMNLLDEFVFSGRNHIRVEVIDPVRDLSRARELQARYKFRADENILIIEYDGRVVVLPIADMAEFDFTPMTVGDEPVLLSFRGEQALTSALMGLVNPITRKVYFLQGHGEPPPGENSPISEFVGYISAQSVNAAPLNPASLDAIPPDGSAVFVIAPQVDLPARVISILQEYWNDDGKLMVLTDPAADTPRLNDFLASTGLRPRGDRILRTVRLGFATGILREVTAEYVAGSPVTRRLIGMNLFLPGESQSIALESPPESDITLRPLVQPAEEFWGEVDHVTDETRGVRYEHGRDAGQPLYVAASSERGGVADDRLGIESAKLVVVGSSEFVLDAAISPQGLDFLTSATHWLLERPQFTGAAPKPAGIRSLHLSQADLAFLSTISLLVMPGAAALIALLVWLRRRA